jgi:hypothetical protein
MKLGKIESNNILRISHKTDNDEIQILLNDGWLPLEEYLPSYDESTQYLANDGYVVLDDRIIVKYRVEDIPEKEEPRDLEVEIEEDTGMLALMVSMLMSEVDMLKSEIENLKEGK